MQTPIYGSIPLFFLTAVDTERLNIRGSRDPLGLVPIWGHFGRKVVGNLTTASNSARGFTTLLLGLHFAERVAAGASDRESARLAAFLKFEQLAGYARVVRNEDESIRGITQIKRRLDENPRSVTIGSSQDLQILSNQKTYGLWGLFIMPAIASGLVISKDLTLTPAAREFIETEHLPMFFSNGRDQGMLIEKMLARERFDVEPEKRDKSVFDVLGKVLSPMFKQRERDFYHAHLILGGDEASKTTWQPQFAVLLEDELKDETEFDHVGLLRLIKVTKEHGPNDLHLHLLKIRDLEALLVAMGNLFGFLQQRDNGSVKAITGELEQTWGNGLRHIDDEAIADLQLELAGIFGNSNAAQRLALLAKALRHGRFEEGLDLILAHNKFVMNTRNDSQAWMQRIGDRLEVRYRDSTERKLVDPKALATTWRSTFYIDPLKTVSDQIMGRVQ